MNKMKALLAALVLLASCNQKDGSEDVNYFPKLVEEVKVEGELQAEKIIIDNDNRKITIHFPLNSNPEAVRLDFVLADGADIVKSTAENGYFNLTKANAIYIHFRDKEYRYVILSIYKDEEEQESLMREGPVNDMALLYYGGSHRPNQWENPALQSNVSYTDLDGVEHWLFDSFLFLESNAGNGRYFESGYDNGENTDGIAARKEDWKAMLDKYFAEDGPIARLNTVISNTATRIGAPKYKRRLVIFIPAAFYLQTNWGELNGKALDFSVTEDRVAASVWWVDYAIEKFNSLNLKYLSFDGIYYVAEQLTNNRQYLPELASEIKKKGLKFYWIPYWQADGMGEWKAMGFDEAFLQPNYFFYQQKPDYQSYFDRVMGYAQAHGMSLEMEFDERGLKKSIADYRADRLWDYLKAFQSYEVAKNNHVAYYQSDMMAHALHCSSDEDDQALYHELCSFILSRQQAKGEN